MAVSNLSICIPSKRNLSASKESISCAIGFCEATNSQLIVSDNSNDENKVNLWNSFSLPYFKFVSNKKRMTGQPTVMEYKIATINLLVLLAMMI